MSGFIGTAAPPDVSRTAGHDGSSSTLSSRLFVCGLAVLVMALMLPACSVRPDRAQVTIGPAWTFQVELAVTPQQQQQGLAGRDSVSEGAGMLFVFDSPRTEQVWMAGMKVAIDIAWVVEGQVVGTDTLQPCRMADQAQCPRWTSPKPVTSLLEVPAGALAGVPRGAQIAIKEF